MTDIQSNSPSKSGILALLLLCSLVLTMPGAANAGIYCHIADPQDDTVNVRETPGGRVVNRLRNERVVRISETKKDDRGRTWASVQSIYRGDWRNWGWVFGKHLDCVNAGNFARERPSFRVLEAAGILPHTFFDP